MGTLYIVATPIGNLEDFTFRAQRILNEVNLIAAEDTRQTKKLLNHYRITTPIISFREAASKDRIARDIAAIIHRLKSDESLAYVSDAGTPGLSDPGQFLVQKVAEAGIPISPIPGPSALTAAISAAGISSQKILFLGFLPKKKGRVTLLKNLAKSVGKSFEALVIYENQHRLIRTLTDLASLKIIIKQVIVFRELTKIHEEIIRGNHQDIITYFEKNPNKLRGEFTVVFSLQNEK